MSGFQIPGLGQAKPNETLPPFAADAQPDQSTGDDTVMTTDQPVNGKPENEQTPLGAEAQAQTQVAQDAKAVEAADAMAIDRPASPPSLTGALEAAIGGLDEPMPALAEEATESSEAREQQIAAEAQAQQAINAEAQAHPEPAQGGQPEWEADSSPYESSSDSSSSDSSDDDSDDEPYELLGVEETARLLMEAEGGSDDEGDRAGKAATNAQVRTKNEMAEEAIPKPDVTITPEMKIEELGSIQNIVEGIALIKAITPGEYQVLDTGSVLCTSERLVIGAVAETIGKVLQPLYTVRFSTPTEPSELGLEVGTKIFYPVDHAHYVFTEPLKNLKGSDASNIHDEEVGDEEMEFSDDEKEAEYKRSLKQKKRERARGGAGAAKGGKEPHPLRQEMQTDGGLNYDDDDDGPYKPLTRPPGFGSGPVSTETYEPQPRGGFRGGKRGDARGRGGRGRGGRGGRGGSSGPSRDGYALPPQGQQYSQASGSQPAWGAQQAPPPPAAPGFGFQMPGWPQPPPPGSSGAPPPPPPGWQAQGQAAQGQANPAFNPALFAALLSQMQQQQQQQGGGQQGWGQQPPPPPGQ